MALRDMTLSVIISAKDRLSAPLRNIEGRLGGLEARLRASAGNVADFNRKWEQTINLTRGVGAAITVASGAMLAGTGAMIQAATDLGEAINKVNVIFKGNGAALEAWAQDSATRLGLSKRAALEAAGSFGVLFDALDPSEAARMSESLVQLAADIASINNIDPEEALLRLRAGLVGETEPLRRVGILLNAVEVEAKAVAMGLRDGNGVVSEAAKVQARYALIMEKSAVQQGDFARTSDQAANQQRILRAEIENAAAAAGGALKQGYESALAALLPLVDAATKFIETPLGQEAVRIAAGMAMVGAAIGPLLYTLPTIIAHWTAISGAATAAWAAMTGPVGLVVAGVAAVGYALYEVATASERVRAAQEEYYGVLESGAESASARVERLRQKLEETAGAAADVRDNLPEEDTPRERGKAEALEEEARLRERIDVLTREHQRAVEAYGEQSRQALETDLRLRERQRELIALHIDMMERLGIAVADTSLAPNMSGMERLRAYDEDMGKLTESFRTAGREIEGLQRDLERMGELEADAAQVTPQLTKEQEALAAATKRAADAATDYGRTQRDAARDVDDARERISEAEQDIADAVEDRAERIADANRRVIDAQADLARAVEDAAERVEDAQERAARSVESAEERISDIRERIAELDAPELTPEQRKQKRRMDLLKELGEAEEELARTKARTQEDVRKAEEDAARTVEQATRRVQEAEKARGDAIEQAEERVRAAYKRREDAVEALALAEERANERIAAAIDKVTEANEKLARAQAKVNGGRPSGVQQGPGTPAGGAGAVAAPIPIQPVYVMPPAGAQPRFVPTPTPQVAMRGAGGGELHVYLHSDPGFVLDTAKQRAGEIIGSVNGRPAVVHIVRDMFARR